VFRKEAAWPTEIIAAPAEVETEEKTALLAEIAPRKKLQAAAIADPRRLACHSVRGRPTYHEVVGAGNTGDAAEQTL
jgi:hypothetical protein